MSLRNWSPKTFASAIPAIPAIHATSGRTAGTGIAKIAGIANSTEAEEIRSHLARLCGESHPDFPEALTHALENPGMCLESFRADPFGRAA